MANHSPYPPRSKQRCENCYYYVPVSQAVGECRAKPPKDSLFWPKVFPIHWCGAWSPLEESCE